MKTDTLYNSVRNRIFKLSKTRCDNNQKPIACAPALNAADAMPKAKLYKFAILLDKQIRKAGQTK